MARRGHVSPRGGKGSEVDELVVAEGLERGRGYEVGQDRTVDTGSDTRLGLVFLFLLFLGGGEEEEEVLTTHPSSLSRYTVDEPDEPTR